MIKLCSHVSLHDIEVPKRSFENRCAEGMKTCMVTIGNDSDIFSGCSILIRNLLDVLVDHINTSFNCFTSTEHIYFFSSVSAVIS